MAYKNLLSQACADNEEVFQRFRDFMCKRNGTYDYSTTGVGWTLHDSSYAVDEDNLTVNDYFVMYSAGESGDQDLYCKVLYQSGTSALTGYLYWNNSTHAGVQAYGGTSDNWERPADAVASTLWIYADMDAVYGVCKDDSADYYVGSYGHMPDSPISQSVTTAAGAISSGSSVVVAMPSVPAAWSVGTKLVVRDNAHIEISEITAISALNVTFDSFTYSYSAGSKFALQNTYFGQYNDNFASTAQMLIAHNGTLAANCSMLWISTSISGDDTLTGLANVIKKYHGSATYGVIGPQPHVLLPGSGLSQETALTDGVTDYRSFNINSTANSYVMFREV